MRPIPIDNPPNRFRRELVEYFDEPPIAGLQVFEDASSSIVARNDSPDLGFSCSLNPYRGCGHGCAYCLSGETRILMADGRLKPLAELSVGDSIYGSTGIGQRLRYVRTRVLDHWRVIKPAFQVMLEGKVRLTASGDHRFLSGGGWKHVAHTGGEGPSSQLRSHDSLLGPAGPKRVRAVEPLGDAERLFDITTGTGDFIAEGFVSHNCYARPSHEYLGFGAGSDFERKIVVKTRAPELLRETFEKKSWVGELIVFSGNTDCYQPIEASFELTRRCLEVCAAYRNPVHIITKSALIERDLEVLEELAGVAELGVTITIPFLDAAVSRAIEPYAPTPERRFTVLRRLAERGIRVSVNVAPVIPGLNDRDVPGILERARDSGARRAGFVPLRLPGSVAGVFEERLRAALPLAAEKILRRTREMRGGRLNDPRFGERMRGSGEYIRTVESMFRTTAERLGFETGMPRAPARSSFRRPERAGPQLSLFGEEP